jgi:ParB/RepB/Spo0J family partition protein
MATKKQRAQTTLQPEGEFRNIALTQIDFSPLNYRKYFSADDLQSFARELAQHGIISPLTVRQMPSGRYELVAGERRLRAATIAALREVPCVVRPLTDEEVNEWQLAENIQRENPHPLHEAQAIGRMMKTRKTIEEIAARLGKSRQFVYARLKLLSLIEPFHELFLADKITLQQAVEIASLSAASQQEFYEAECSEWQDEEFELDNLSYTLRQYRYDLTDAPFDLKDKKLLAGAGACTTCTFNTATLKSLFPEYAQQAVCTKKECFHQKCVAYAKKQLQQLVREHAPTALLLYREPSGMVEELLSAVPETDGLQRLLFHQVSTLDAPEEPDAADYAEDAEGYLAALTDYALESEQYQQEVELGTYQKAILVSNRELHVLWCTTEKNTHEPYAPARRVTAKAVQAALKEGTATAELLQNAIDSIRERENRAQELDREKVQQQVREVFIAQVENSDAHPEFTLTDLTAAILLVYQSMNWSSRQQVDEKLFPNGQENVYEAIKALSEPQYAQLVRMAIAAAGESTLPSHPTGVALVDLAKVAGVNVSDIEDRQRQKAAERSQRQEQKIAELEKKISEHSTTA